MGIEEKLPSGFLLTSVEQIAGYMRKSSLWPATFGLACCAIEMMTTGGPKYDLARFGMEVFRASPRQADLMIVAGRVSQKMAPVLRQIYDQMVEPKWVLSMGVCASSGGMFNNYAIVQGVDHVVPVDIYLPGCPPRPEMLINALLALHEEIQAMPLGVNRRRAAEAAERAAQEPSPKSSRSGGACSARRTPATPPATTASSARSRCPRRPSGLSARTSTPSPTP
jgi:NADH-quinone oxidoreductase subunit B